MKAGGRRAATRPVETAPRHASTLPRGKRRGIAAPDPTLSKVGRRTSAVEQVLLGLVVLVPLGFSRWTEDAWDFPKAALLTSGALLIAAWALASELGRLRASGPGPWLGEARRRFVSTVRRDPIGGALLAFVLSSALSTLVSPNPGLGFFGAPGHYTGTVIAAAIATVYFASRSSSGGVAWFRRLGIAAAVVTGLSSLYGLAQFVGRDPLKWDLVASLDGMRRVPGTFGQPNLLAVYLAMTLPVIVWLIARSRAAGRAAWIAVGAVALVTLASTLSRAAWLACGASALIGLVIHARTRGGGGLLSRPRTRWIASLVLIAALAAGGLVLSRTSFGSRIVTRIRDIANPQEMANLSRLQNWRSSLRMFADKPVLGVGTEQFGLEFSRYRTVALYRLESGALPVTAHNVVIHVLATQGIVGIAAALLVVLFAFRAVREGLRHPDPWTRGAVVAATAALSTFGLWELVNYTVVAVATLAAILLGWVSRAAHDAAVANGLVAAPARSARAGARPVWAVAVAGLVLAVAFVPLVLNPWRAQVAQRSARDAGAGSDANLAALTRATLLAPWDGRHEHHLASSYFVAALAQVDTSQRVALLQKGRAAEERAIRIEPRNALFHATQGSILTQLLTAGDPRVRAGDVVDAYARAIERDPANLEIHCMAARSLVAVSDYAQAREAASRAASLYPEAPEPIALLGLVALKELRFGDAVDTLKLSLERDWRGDAKGKARALVNLSGAYLATHRFAEARAAAEQALSHDPGSSAAAANRDVAERWLALEAAQAHP